MKAGTFGTIGWRLRKRSKASKETYCIRPIFHQLQRRIEAHVFVCFLAYCVEVTLRHQLRAKAPGLTVGQVLEKFGRRQMMDVHFPSTDDYLHAIRTLVATVTKLSFIVFWKGRIAFEIPNS